ncbi:hypothetical protein EMCRGX_G007718 [Ephydatia muelleri]
MLVPVVSIFLLCLNSYGCVIAYLPVYQRLCPEDDFEATLDFCTKTTHSLSEWPLGFSIISGPLIRLLKPPHTRKVDHIYRHHNWPAAS